MINTLYTRVKSSRWKEHILPCCLFGLFLAITLFRKVTFFGHPRFWAEEGTLHFANSFSQPWLEALFKPQIGYLNFWANFATVLAVQVPLEYAPLVTTILALIVQILPLILILYNQSVWQGWLKKFLSIVIFFFVPLTEEVWLNSVNSYTYWVVIAFLILLDSEPTGRFRKVFYRSLLAFCGLSGVSANFLLPFFYYRAWVERKHERWIQSIIFTFFTVIQAAIVLLYRGGAGFADRFYRFDFHTFSFIIWNQTFGLFSLGVTQAGTWAKDLIELAETNFAVFQHQTWGILPLTILFFILLLHNLPCGHQRILYLGSYLILTFTTFLFSAISNKYDLAHTGVHQRIFLAPNIVFGWMLLRTIRFSRSFHWRAIVQNMISLAAVGLLTTALFWGSIQYWRNFTAGEPWPNWKSEVQAWRADPSYPLKIQPNGWEVILKK